ncbi:GntR family transcriptional regulator [Clostridia bacterium]|nr:GntR family transcriptional regulator [Clostridia bacterium]
MEKNRYKSKSELVFEEIWERVTHGILKPGDRFSAQEIAEELGVSRTPVNEAMKRMSEYGLIRILPNVGYQVNVLRWRDIEDIMRIECLLETEGLRLNKNGFDSALIQELKDINRRTIEALERKDRQAYYRLTDEFHVRFIHLSGSRILQDVFVKNRHYAGWDDGKILEMTESLKELLRDHDAALDLLLEGRLDEAIENLKIHSEQSIQLVHQSLKNSKYPGI